MALRKSTFFGIAIWWTYTYKLCEKCVVTMNLYGAVFHCSSQNALDSPLFAVVDHTDTNFVGIIKLNPVQ